MQKKLLLKRYEKMVKEYKGIKYWVMGVIICICGMIYLFAIRGDAELDTKLCSDYIIDNYNDRDSFRLQSCYANEDLWKINLGKNIKCSCYYDYEDDEYSFTHLDFNLTGHNRTDSNKEIIWRSSGWGCESVESCYNKTNKEDCYGYDYKGNESYVKTMSNKIRKTLSCGEGSRPHIIKE